MYRGGRHQCVFVTRSAVLKDITDRVRSAGIRFKTYGRKIPSVQPATCKDQS